MSKAVEKKKGMVAKNVDEYLAMQPEDVRAALEKLRRAIKAAAPEVEESISYRIPAYKTKGFLVFFQVHPKHCSFVTASEAIVMKLKKELAGFKTSGTTIHFSPQKPLPASLVNKIVTMRIRENDERSAEKRKK